MISLEQGQYCIVLNPVKRQPNESKTIVTSSKGGVELDFGGREIRCFPCQPFPLYPGEKLKGSVRQCPLVGADQFLLLEAILDFVDDETGQKKSIGDWWFFEGPGMYKPRIEVVVKQTLQRTRDTTVAYSQMSTLANALGPDGVHRKAGEVWIQDRPHDYMMDPSISIDYSKLLNDLVIKPNHVALLTAQLTHKDHLGKARCLNEQWVLSRSEIDSYKARIESKLLNILPINFLASDEYAIIADPLTSDGKPALGEKKLVVGPRDLVIHPGESLEGRVEVAYLLEFDQALLVEARCRFLDKTHGDNDKVKVVLTFRKAGQRWLVRGPTSYIPPVCVKVLTRRQLILLDKSEGVYVRNRLTGHVRSVIGQSYMLGPYEELWKKTLPDDLLEIIQEGREQKGEWDRTKVVGFHVPANCLLQVVNHHRKLSRLESGPCLVLLEPDELVTVLHISSSNSDGVLQRGIRKPVACLYTGPSRLVETIQVESSDHLQLKLDLSYSWHFDTSSNVDDKAKMFSVNDYVATACNHLSGLIRAQIASVTFQTFHHQFDQLIKQAVFGLDSDGQLNRQLKFDVNNLIVTGVDVLGVEPIDPKSSQAFDRSMYNSIQLSIASQAASARYQAELVEQKAKAKLEVQQISDAIGIEQSKYQLVEQRCENLVVELLGETKSKAQLVAETKLIECQSDVDSARLVAEARKLEQDSELQRLELLRQAELDYLTAKQQLDLEFHKQSAEIDVGRITSLVQTAGPEFIETIMTAKRNNTLQSAIDSFASCGLLPDLLVNATIDTVELLFNGPLDDLMQEVGQVLLEQALS